MPPVLISLGLLLYRKYGSKNLVNILSIQLLEMSTILHTQFNMNGSFSQFVFDNADFNVCTINGLNTFHAMGGIRCTAPESSVIRRTEIPRLTKIPSSKSSGELGVLPLDVLGKMEGGVKNVIVEDLGVLKQKMAQPKRYDIL
ncbi:hypothetical protein PR048_019530 [Dryococelus australis]|uniref:Uncharacterized protein n=1 Tax=Dryococelus australis TaxID=614101 RepID=A0ABQ9H3Q2_9NEOP|nr:hypothetical protein PR048_019530 [Dryococelus australis]